MAMFALNVNVVILEPFALRLKIKRFSFLSSFLF
jgi:hypothetical protein